MKKSIKNNVEWKYFRMAFKITNKYKIELII